MIPSWPKLNQVVSFCPLAGQEITESFTLLFVSIDTEEDILNSLTG
jgi:hypothetical protein